MIRNVTETHSPGTSRDYYSEPAGGWVCGLCQRITGQCVCRATRICDPGITPRDAILSAIDLIDGHEDDLPGARVVLAELRAALLCPGCGEKVEHVSRVYEGEVDLAKECRAGLDGEEEVARVP